MDESVYKGKIDLKEARKYDPLVGSEKEDVTNGSRETR